MAGKLELMAKDLKASGYISKSTAVAVCLSVGVTFLAACGYALGFQNAWQGVGPSGDDVKLKTVGLEDRDNEVIVSGKTSLELEVSSVFTTADHRRRCSR